jgi:hypothetical protein
VEPIAPGETIRFMVSYDGLEIDEASSGGTAEPQPCSVLGAQGLPPLLLAGALRIAYDLELLARFQHLRPGEEHHR